MTNMSEVVEGVILKKTTNIRAVSGGPSKQVTLEVDYNGLLIQDIFAKALKDDVISWANGSGGRKNFENIVNGSTIKVSAKHPGSLQTDPETAMINKLVGMGEQEREDFLLKMIEKARAKTK